MAGSHSNRRASTRRRWVVALGLLGAMVAGAAIGVVLAILAASDRDTDPRSARPGSSSSDTVTPSDTASTDPSSSGEPDPTFSPTAVPPEPLDLARATKPLQALERGDRVLYDANPERPVCTWLLWAGSIATSRIQCGTETFEVETGFLTPVERVP